MAGHGHPVADGRPGWGRRGAPHLPLHRAYEPGRNAVWLRFGTDHRGTVGGLRLRPRRHAGDHGAGDGAHPGDRLLSRLQVIRQDGVELWSAGAHPSHAGWTSVFACKIDGEDYLLQYEPEMYQGWAEYAYELWAFDGNGQAYTSDNRSVTFDINFGREEHQFDPEAIAGFFWELRGLLQDSILLASTENGEFQTGIPGLELQNYIFSDLLSLDSLEAMEASVRQQEAELGAA